ncbi:MAG: hypothetical protein ACFFDM_00340 [Candidatus Thorarchaeota archaeon]
MKNIVEGYFLVTNQELVFEVKGSIHPDDGYIAYLRYIPSKTGKRVSKDGKNYRKVYPLEDRESYLRKKFPQYLRYESSYGRVLQIVPAREVAFILNPVDALRGFRDRESHLSPIQYSTLRLATRLVESCGISWDYLGVTGSQLVGLETKDSDIDLAVFGKNSGRKLFSALKSKLDTIEGIERYSDEALNRHTAFRWGTNNSYFNMLREIERKKVLQGLFNGYDFFIRLVMNRDEVGHSYGACKYEEIGVHVLRCSVIDDSNSIFTPCEYSVKCIDQSDIKKIVSYRGRYTEHVSAGVEVEAKGRLEAVRDAYGEKWLQLVLGESDNDYLIPID